LVLHIEAIVLGRQDRVACVERLEKTPQDAPSVEFTEGFRRAATQVAGIDE
jgi:hypothetical protein